MNVIKNPLNAVGAGVKKLAGGGSGDTDNINVAAAIAWLRSKTYPDYPAGSLMSAPPKLVLYLPGSGITSFIGPYKTDSVPVLMRSCNVEYESFFNNGAPRVAVVTLEFVETIQVGDTWGYVSQSNVEVSWKQQGRSLPDSTLGYTNGNNDTILTDQQKNVSLPSIKLPKISLF